MNEVEPPLLTVALTGWVLIEGGTGQAEVINMASLPLATPALFTATIR